MKILLIDNYDSFTYNLYHYISSLKHKVEIYRNDKIDINKIKKKKYQKIVISPGPGHPGQSGNCIKVVKYLGEDYVSAMRYSKVMIGNSSSGVIEAASFKLPVINIGLRQKGRMMPKNVINTSFDKMKIIKSIKYSQSKEFLKKIKNLKNPYENKNFSNNLKKIFSDLSIIKKNKLIAKKFIDLKI